MEKLFASVRVDSLVLPTYLEPEAEEMPMFAENRVHQRTSGNPYPNKIVSAVDRVNRVDKEYIAVHLENKYVHVVILPELGGRVYSATDKSTGYDFFYKQHVIKPALIGVLGSALVLIVIALMDDTIHDEEYVLRTYDYPILAKVPDLVNSGGKRYGYYYRYKSRKGDAAQDTTQQ